MDLRKLKTLIDLVSESGISSTQGGHQDPQKFTTRTFPCQSLLSSTFPSGDCHSLAKKAFTAGSLTNPVLEIQGELKIPARSAKRLIPLITIHCLRFTASPSLKFANAYSYLRHLRHIHGRHCRNRSSGWTSRYWLRRQRVSTNEHAA